MKVKYTIQHKVRDLIKVVEMAWPLQRSIIVAVMPMQTALVNAAARTAMEVITKRYTDQDDSQNMKGRS